MTKVAKLVLLSVMTRVVVEEGADDSAIFDAAQEKLKGYGWDIGDMESVKDDTELPFGELDGEK